MGCGAAVGACVSNATALVGFFVSPSPVSFDVSLVGSGVIPGIGVGVGVGLGVGVGFRATEGVGVGFAFNDGKKQAIKEIFEVLGEVGKQLLQSDDSFAEAIENMKEEIKQDFENYA